MHQMWRLSEAVPQNLGLACTDDGLLLGRTSLIERRDGRFVVRARGKIERLLKCAYDGEPPVDRLMSGLARVASALNANDQCLARIAAVHLQMPDLASAAVRDGLLPLPWIESDTDAKTICSNWGWVFLGNLIGSVVYGALLAIALTNFGATAPAGVAAKIVAIAEAKTTGYEALGYAGLITVFVKAILCNWMVCLAIVAAMTTSSTIGKIACAYMPVFIFFAQGF
jgi:formate/nitrite transporter